MADWRRAPRWRRPGTLVLAVATFSAVRSANAAARTAERSLQVGLRPLLMPARPEDPAEKVVRALAAPTRLRLFLALFETERCVTDLVASEGVAQPPVSHHSRVLADAGLVQARRADGFKLYAVNLDGMAAARALVIDLFDPDAVNPRARPGGNEDCCR